MSQPKLTYFEGVGFRALPFRLAFEIAGVPYEDHRISFDEWGTTSGDRSKYPTGTLPVLNVKGQTIAQSRAISEYAARTAGLHRTDPLEVALVDEVQQNLEELISGEGGVAGNKLDRQEWLKAKNLPFWLTRIESQATGDKFFLPGDKPSLADFWILGFMDFFASGVIFKQCEKGDFAPYAKLRRISENVKAIPAVANYFKKYPKDI
jgi:glutathione S-transferase